MAASLYQFDQQSKNFYEKSPFPIMIYQLVDGQYQVLLLSEGYCNMVKSGRASMMAYLGQHNLSRVHPEDRSRLYNFIQQVDQKKAHRLTYRLSIEGHYHQLLAYCKTQIDNGIKLLSSTTSISPPMDRSWLTRLVLMLGKKLTRLTS